MNYTIDITFVKSFINKLMFKLAVPSIDQKFIAFISMASDGLILIECQVHLSTVNGVIFRIIWFCFSGNLGTNQFQHVILVRSNVQGVVKGDTL